jgi:predicted P-loop ATPase/GTPase
MSEFHNRIRQLSKWTGICRYTIPKLIFVSDIHTGTCQYIVTNSQVLFHNGSLLHSKFSTQLLITVHNSSTILTQVQLLPVLEHNSQITFRKSHTLQLNTAGKYTSYLFAFQSTTDSLLLKFSFI